jgi:predicted alpha/beta superfamily hydrolase
MRACRSAWDLNHLLNEENVKQIVTCVLVLGLLGSAIVAREQTSAPARVRAVVEEGAPVTIARAKQYDISSRINGQRYRIMVATPYMGDPAVAYPVLYVLDGSVYFGTAAETLTRQSFLKTVAPAIVVGVGYPTDDQQEMTRRRAIDLTPSVSKGPNFVGGSGGGDAFLRVLEEEVKPFVAERYKVDRAKQIIWGQSLGGLIVLRAMFRNPTAFSTYVLSSPSIFFNKREVLGDEEAFSKRARAGELHLKVLVTSAGDEQYRGDDPQRLAAAADTRMVDNASELAARLKALNPQNITVERIIFEGEIHNTVPQASLSRALRFALPQ